MGKSRGFTDNGKGVIPQWREKIGKDDRWAYRAALVIFSRQTEYEKFRGTSQQVNGMGFSRLDAPLLTGIVISSQSRRLSRRELDVLRARMPKYSKQLYRSKMETFTSELKNRLESYGVEFRKEEGVWNSYLGGEHIVRRAQLGTCIWETARELGEET